jgi:hypothetical protein
MGSGYEGNGRAVEEFPTVLPRFAVDLGVVRTHVSNDIRVYR